MESITLVVFLVSFAAALLVFGLSAAGFFCSTFEFWPPPGIPCWQSRVFRSLFRVFFLGLVFLSIVEFDPALWRTASGIPLALVGFGCAVYWTSFLGWGSAYGKADGLRTDGIYRWSRNPIYLASLLGMIGWGFAVGSSIVTILLVLWGTMYYFAPMLEEPWLIKQYGTDYQSYMKRTPRYFGHRRD